MIRRRRARAWAIDRTRIDRPRPALHHLGIRRVHRRVHRRHEGSGGIVRVEQRLYAAAQSPILSACRGHECRTLVNIRLKNGLCEYRFDLLSGRVHVCLSVEPATFNATCGDGAPHRVKYLDDSARTPSLMRPLVTDMLARHDLTLRSCFVLCIDGRTHLLGANEQTRNSRASHPPCSGDAAREPAAASRGAWERADRAWARR